MTGTDQQDADSSTYLIGATSFVWAMLAVIAGLGYGISIRAVGCPLVGATILGVAGGVSVLTFLSRQQWGLLFSTRRGRILLITSLTAAVASGLALPFTLTATEWWIEVLAGASFGSVAFGGTLRVTDRFIGE